MIDLRDIACAYGPRALLTGLDLRVAAGEVLGVLGRNGVGKTSLLRIALGLQKPQRGTVRIADVDLATLSALQIARRVAAMAQDEPLAFTLTVQECVLLGRVAHLPPHGFESKADLAAAAAAMEEVGVSALADRSLETLSGGERRRVLLARVLAQSTDALVLDEPAENLDLAYQLALFELLQRRARRGAAVLLTVHDLNLALRYCDRIALLIGDGTAAIGPPRDILTPERIAAVFGVEVATGQLADGTPFYAAVRVRE